MISFFPDVYPDELAYSWFARYGVRSGYTHMTIKDDAVGIKRYSTIYYSENEIRKMTEGEIHAYKELKAKKRSGFR